jgi:hypothetical protein
MLPVFALAVQAHAFFHAAATADPSAGSAVTFSLFLAPYFFCDDVFCTFHFLFFYPAGLFSYSASLLLLLFVVKGAMV